MTNPASLRGGRLAALDIRQFNTSLLAVIGLACVVFGGLSAWTGESPRLAAPSDAAPAPTGIDAAARRPTTSSAAGTAPVALELEPEPSPSPSSETGAAGCAAPSPCSVVQPGGVIDHGGSRFALGDPTDELVLADPRCAEAPAVALLRPDDGSIYFFDRWAEPGHDVVARRGGDVPAGAHWQPRPLDGRGCAPLVVQVPGADPVVVDPTPPASQPEPTPDEPDVPTPPPDAATVPPPAGPGGPP